MTYITNLLDVESNKIVPTDKKLSAAKIAIKTEGNLTVSTEGELDVDIIKVATRTFVTESIALAQLENSDVDLSAYSTKEEVTQGLNTKQEVINIDTTENITPELVNALPFYTLKNDGTYVLNEPDVWLKINGYFVPGYTEGTITGND